VFCVLYVDISEGKKEREEMILSRRIIMGKGSFFIFVVLCWE
jgi:hypothetical protein